MVNIQERLCNLRKQILSHEETCQRAAHSVAILAISKKQGMTQLSQAWAEGQRAFGENYLQEALPKIAACKQYLPGIEWHFVGRLQRNKTRLIAENFAWVQSVNTRIVAQRLNKQRPAVLSPLNICIQVKADDDTDSLGVASHQLLEFATYCSMLPRLKLRGLMIMPLGNAVPRAAFAQAHKAFLALREAGFDLDTLSMGTTADLREAIAEGSTLVRVGTGLFGSRHDEAATEGLA